MLDVADPIMPAPIPHEYGLCSCDFCHERHQWEGVKNFANWCEKCLSELEVDIENGDAPASDWPDLKQRTAQSV